MEGQGLDHFYGRCCEHDAAILNGTRSSKATCRKVPAMVDGDVCDPFRQTFFSAMRECETFLQRDRATFFTSTWLEEHKCIPEQTCHRRCCPA